LLSGPIHKASLAAAAAGMAIQGAAIFPRKWESRLIIRPHALAAGSLALFTAAALLLAMFFAGCTPGKSAARLPTSIEFTAENEQFRGACFALTSLGALKRTCCRDDAKDKADRLPLAALLGSRSLERSPAAQQPRWRVFRWAANNRRCERATQ